MWASLIDAAVDDAAALCKDRRNLFFLSPLTLPAHLSDTKKLIESNRVALKIPDPQCCFFLHMR